mgnify:CR=1 FL=1
MPVVTPLFIYLFSFFSIFLVTIAGNTENGVPAFAPKRTYCLFNKVRFRIAEISGALPFMEVG